MKKSVSKPTKKSQPANRLQKFLATYPTVTIGRENYLVDHGGLVTSYYINCEPSFDPPVQEEIDRAKSVLKDAPKTKFAKVGSYSLKFDLEWFGFGEMSNGALIVAAFELGFPLRLVSACNLNAYIGVSSKWWNQLRIDHEERVRLEGKAKRKAERLAAEQAAEPSAKILITLPQSLEGRSTLG